MKHHGKMHHKQTGYPNTAQTGDSKGKGHSAANLPIGGGEKGSHGLGDQACFQCGDNYKGTESSPNTSSDKG